MFNGHNLLLWERAIEAALKPRKLIHHLTEEGPTEDHPNFQKWTMEEEFVFAWLLDSIAPEQMPKYISYDNSKKLWDAIRRSHSKKGDKTRIIGLIIKSYTLKQGEKDVLTYSNELREIYNELDHCYPLSTDPMARTREATNRVCLFLQGLRPEFEIARSQLFNRDEEPTFDEAVMKVIQEESRLKALQGAIEGTAYLMKEYKKRNDPEKVNKEDLLCTYCNKRGHIREKCWKLHGKPPHIARAHLAAQQGAYATTSGGEGLPSAQDFQKMMQELQSLKAMINSSKTVIGSTSLANCGNPDFLNFSFFTNEWILDSGATDHMTSVKDFFITYEKIIPGKHVQTADGTLLPVIGIGNIKMQPIGILTNVLHIPKLFVSLISVQRLAKIKEYNILFDDLDAYLCNKVQGWKIGLARIQQGLYHLPWQDPKDVMETESKVAAIKASPEEEIMKIHQRMGHPSFYLLKHMYPHLFEGNKIEMICDACQLGKFKRTTYPSNDNRKLKPFQLIHCDVWGPAPKDDILGNKYFLICTDDFSRFSWLFLLKQKTEVTSTIKNLINTIENQFSERVKGLRTDNAKDFLNRELREFLASKGIIHETSCPYTPQQNGLAERKIGDIVDKGRTLLIQANAPVNMWGFAVMTAIHLINRLPSRTLDYKSPIEILEKNYPSVRLKTGLPVRVFGCIAYVHNSTHKQNKLSAKAIKCVFIGYSTTQKGYKLYHPITRRYIVQKDVVFDEDNFFYKQTGYEKYREVTHLITLEDKAPLERSEVPLAQESIPYTIEGTEEQEKIAQNPDKASDHDQGTVPLNNIVESNCEGVLPYPKYYERKKKRNSQKELPVSNINQETVPLNDTDAGEVESNEGGDDLPIALRKKSRACVKPIPYEMVNYLNYSKVSPQYKAFLTTIQDIPIPKTTDEAMKSTRWKEAMDEEMRALLENNTWEIIDLPDGKKSVSCRWVYTIKCKEDGSLDRYKARLVARGYTQTYGIDYQETFAPVAKINTIRILISLAVNLDWPLNQYDIKNAFLHGDLREEIYMDLPPGYGSTRDSRKVCKLKKALYGLKQSPRAWFGKFTLAMKTLGYRQCNGEHTLFYKHASRGLVTILIVYVDDIIITGNNLEELRNLETQLDKNFRVKKLGPLKYFLGIEFARSSEGILMTQQKYILELLEQTKHLNCHVSDTPIEVNHKLKISEDDPRVEPLSYQEIVGKLVYLSHTRPDICYAVNVLSQFMHSPRTTHFQALYKVLRYLKGTTGLGIAYRKTGKLDLNLYTDSDFAGSRVDYRSTTGYCTILGGNLVTWRSKKQSVVSKSSTEAEFRAMSKGIDEVMWIKHMLDELRVPYLRPIIIRCDNRSAISIAHDPVDHDKMKHVNIDRFYIQDHLERGIVKTEHVTSEEQCADIFTKGLPTKTMKYLISKLGMTNMHS